jgi:hypothetical protein
MNVVEKENFCHAFIFSHEKQLLKMTERGNKYVSEFRDSRKHISRLIDMLMWLSIKCLKMPFF